jgi:membrane protein
LVTVCPAIILFCGLTLFYKLAPTRGAPFSAVWQAGLLVTIILSMVHGLMTWYLGNFSDFNALYGVFGTIMTLLLWVYVAGSIIIFGSCVAATSPSIK